MGEGAGDLFAVGIGVEREREADVDSFDHQYAVSHPAAAATT